MAEWFGNIPNNWRVKKAKFLFIERKEKGNELNLEILTPSQKFGVIPQIKYQELTGSKPVQVEENKDISLFKTVHKGDFCISLSSYMGGFEYSEYEGVISPAYHNFYAITKEYNNYYLKYLFKSVSFINEINKITPISVRVGRNTSFEKFKEVLMPIPPKEKQFEIVKFLDKRLVEIDNIIEKTKITIKDYKKYKESIITKAVTKGINKNIEYKDSLIDWIGNIPKGWNIVKLRYLGTLQNGISASAEKFGYGYPFANYGDIYNNYNLPTELSGLINSNKKEREKYSIKRGDIFFTRTSETIEEVGLSCVAEKDFIKTCFSGFIIRFRPNNDNMLPEFYKYYFRSHIHRKYLVKEMNIVTRASLGQDLLNNMPVLIPSMKEQKEIAQYLENKCKEIEKLVESKENLIGELENYKQSLIYEYVTGKKEINNEVNYSA